MFKRYYYIIVFLLLLLSCENKKSNRNHIIQDSIALFDSVIINLKPNDLLNQPLKDVVNKLRININNKHTFLSFYDEPVYDSLNNKKFDYFLFDYSKRWTKIELCISLSYSEIPFYVLNSIKSDSLIWEKVKNKKVQKVYIETNKYNISYKLR